MPPMLVPSVTADPGHTPDLQGGAVAPVRNAAPQQIGQLGEALTRAGSAAFVTGQTIGTKIAETVDDANVRSAETSFLQNAQGIVTEYTHKLGKDAMDAYPDATTALSKAKQDAMGGLSNDIQKKMFSYVSTQHLMQFGRQMGDHNFQQTVNYGVEEHTNSAIQQMNLAGTNYSDWQIPGGTFAKYKKNGVSETLQSASLAGHPPNSATAIAAVQKQTSALADIVLTQMTGQEHYNEAQTYYQAAVKNNELDDQMLKKWAPVITEGHNAEKAANAADEEVQAALGGPKGQQQIAPLPGGSLIAVPAKENPASQAEVPPVEGKITDVMGAPREGHEHHGIDYGVPVGTKVIAPLDGTVSRVWDDQTGGGLSMEVSYPDGSKHYFMHLSTQNYQEGQKVTQGAVLGLTGQTGNATGPVLHWAKKDPQGNWVDPRNDLQAPQGDTTTPQAVAATPRDPLHFTEPDMLETALKGMQARTDLTDRQKLQGEAKIERLYTIATNLKQGKYENAKKAAVDLYYQQNGSIAGLDPAIKSQLTAEDIYRLNRPIPRENNEDTVLDLLAHPEKVVPGQIEKYRMDLSPETYERFFAKAQENAKPDSPNVLDTSLDRNQLNTLLATNNMASLVDPKANTEEAQRKIDLVTSIDDQIDAEQSRLGRKLSRTEKQTIMTQTIADTAFVHHTFAKDKEVPIVTLTADQAGKAYVSVGGERIKLASIPAADQQMINDAWRQVEQEHGWAHRPLSGQEMAAKWVQLRNARKVSAAPAAVAPAPVFNNSPF